MILTELQRIFNIMGDEDEGFDSFLEIINQSISLFNIYSKLSLPLFPTDPTEVAIYEHPVMDEVFWRAVILIWAQVWINRYVYKDLNVANAYEIDAQKSTTDFLSGNNEFKNQYKATNKTKIIYRANYAKHIDLSTDGSSTIGIKGIYENLKFSDTVSSSQLEKQRAIVDFNVLVEHITEGDEKNIRVRLRSFNTNDDRVLPLSPGKISQELAYEKAVNATLPDVRYTLEETLTLAVNEVLPNYVYVSNNLDDNLVQEIENNQVALRCFEVLFDKDIDLDLG